MLSHKTPTLFILLLLVFAPTFAAAQQHPSSDLLLPYFEVDLTGFQLTTSFQIANNHDDEVSVEMVVHTNWGIPVVETEVTLQPFEMRAFNLRDWLMMGRLPDRELGPAQLAHVQAAVAGLASPKDDLYYGSPVDTGIGVGYVTIRNTSLGRPDSLWGTYFVIDPREDSAQADVLANIDPATDCHDLCTMHSLFFLEGGDFDGGTELLIWTGRRGQPSSSSFGPASQAELAVDSYDPAGLHQASLRHDTLSVRAVRLADLGLSQLVGTLKLTALSADGTSMASSFIAVRYSAEGRYSAGLKSWCDSNPPPEPPGRAPAVDIEKATNGQDADEPTGPEIEEGDPVQWEYLVTNTGNTPLLDIVVTDDDPSVTVSCPETTLAARRSMTCTASGIATVGQYANIGTVTAHDADGTEVDDEDPSHYLGVKVIRGLPTISIEKATNGHDADQPTGPEISEGNAVIWTYVVSNGGPMDLEQVEVTDDDPSVTPSCPKDTLDAGESMTCTASGVAVLGQYANVGTVVGQTSDGQTATASDPSHYLGKPVPPKPVAVDIEKATNNQDADNPTGPEILVGNAVTWTYVVTNTGHMPLENLVVTDDDPAVSPSCPKSVLAVGESMTCSASGSAVLGQYANVGTVTGQSTDDRPVSDSDPSHYLGTELPPIAVDIEKATNGQDADSPTGPTIPVGAPVTWTYVVTNTGGIALRNLVVADDDAAVSPSCPKSTLAVGESMTCSASGTAEAGQYANIGSVTGKDAHDRSVGDSDPSHYFGEEPEEPPCGDCEGKITRLTLRYLGSSSATIRVEAKRGPETVDVYNAVVAPGGSFQVVGPTGGTPGHAGTLGTEIRLYIDGVYDTFIHTSCSVDVGPGYTAGDFQVLAGESQGGGALCPL